MQTKMTIDQYGQITLRNTERKSSACKTLRSFVHKNIRLVAQTYTKNENIKMGVFLSISNGKS